ncbi:MAG: hypothetical protein KH431_08120 [Erysipelotrichaceae bacterium]|nr:hypothetical protein [Erysipelotrichaceae bacterium]
MKNYQDYKRMMMDCFRDNRVKLTVMVIVLQLLNALIGYADAMITENVSGSALLMYVLLFGLLLIVNFALLFVFLSTLRGSCSIIEEAKYSLKRFPTELGFTVLMSIFSTMIMMLLAIMLTAIPMLYMVLAFIVSVIVVILQCFFAFAVHDGCKGVFSILATCITLLKRNWKPLVRAMIPYLVFSLVVSFALQLLIQGQFKNSVTTQQAIIQAFDKQKLTLAYEILGLYLLNYLGSAVLLTYVYLYYAQVYETEIELFPVQNPISGTITIDIVEEHTEDI